MTVQRPRGFNMRRLRWLLADAIDWLLAATARRAK